MGRINLLLVWILLVTLLMSTGNDTVDFLTNVQQEKVMPLVE